MKNLLAKKIIIIVLSVLATAGVAVGVAALAGAFDSPDSSPQSSLSSSSSSVQEPDPIVEVQRGVASEVLSANFETLTLKDVYLVAEGDFSIAGKLTDGVVVGDLINEALSSFVKFYYYSNDIWYVKNKDGNLVPFNKVNNAIFNYQIGAGEPLALSELDLITTGDKTVMENIEIIFKDVIEEEIDLGQGDSSISNMILSMLPSGLADSAKIFTQMTVRDLYNITDGDYSYITNYLESTDVDVVVNAIFDIIELATDEKYEDLKKIACDLIAGTIANPQINNEIETDIDTLIYYIADALSRGKDIDTRDEIDDWKNYFRSLFEGNLNDIKIQDGADFTRLVKAVIEEMGVEVEKSEDMAKRIISLVQGTDALLKDLKAHIDGANNNLEESLTNSIVDLFEVDKNNPQAMTFIEDLSHLVVHYYALDNIEAFAEKYKDLTLAEIDGYLSSAITEISKALGYDISADLSNVTVGNVYDIVEKVFAEVGITFDEVISAIDDLVENGAEQGKELFKELIAKVEEYLKENKDLTIGELLGDVDIDEEIANTTLGEISDAIDNAKNDVELDNITIKELDEQFLEGIALDFCAEHGIEELLEMTLAEVLSLVELDASTTALNVLDQVTISEVVKMLESIAADNEVPAGE